MKNKEREYFAISFWYLLDLNEVTKVKDHLRVLFIQMQSSIAKFLLMILCLKTFVLIPWFWKIKKDLSFPRSKFSQVHENVFAQRGSSTQNPSWMHEILSTGELSISYKILMFSLLEFCNEFCFVNVIPSIALNIQVYFWNLWFHGVLIACNNKFFGIIVIIIWSVKEEDKFGNWSTVIFLVLKFINGPSTREK